MKQFILTFLIILHSGLWVSCQSNNERSADDILRPCFNLFDKGYLVDGGKCIEQKLYENPNRAEELSERASDLVFDKCLEIKKSGNYKNAIVCFEGSKELMPENAKVLFNLADSYYSLSKGETRSKEFLDLAAEAVADGLAIQPKDLAAILLYTQILELQGKYEESYQQYMKFVDNEPESTLFWVGLGLTQQKLIRHKDSVESFEKALKIDSNYVPAYFFLAVSYEKLGEKQKAISSLEKLLILEPDEREAREMLIRLSRK